MKPLSTSKGFIVEIQHFAELRLHFLFEFIFKIQNWIFLEIKTKKASRIFWEFDLKINRSDDLHLTNINIFHINNNIN